MGNIFLLFLGKLAQNVSLKNNLHEISKHFPEKKTIIIIFNNSSADNFPNMLRVNDSPEGIRMKHN